MRKALSRLRRIAVAGLVTLVAAACLTGCDDEVDDFTFIPPVVNNPPVAVDDAYEAAGNATLTVTQVSQGVRANDIHNGALVVAFDATTTAGGTVVMNPDGTFVYTPPDNTRGIVDTFTYTIQNVNGTSTATVSITVNNLVFFVDNSAPPGGDGSIDEPFQTIPPAIALAQAGDAIFVFRGTGAAYTGNVVLPDGVVLIGEAFGLFFANGITPRGDDVRAEQIVDPDGFTLIQGPVTMGNDTFIAGFEFVANGVGSSIIVNAVSDVDIFGNMFDNTTDDSIDIDEATGEIFIEGNDFVNLDGGLDAIDGFFSGSTTALLHVDGNTFTDVVGDAPDEALEVDVVGNAQVDVSATGNTVTGSNDGMGWNDGFDIEYGTSNGADTPTGNVDIVDNVFENVVDTPVELDFVGSSSVAAQVNSNLFNNNLNEAVGLFGEDNGFLDIIANDNTVSMTGDESFETDLFDNASVDGSYDNNTMTNVANTGIDVENFGIGADTTTATNNTITNPGADSICILSSGFSTNFVRDNDFTGGDINLFTDPGGDLCADIEGNTVRDINLGNDPAALMFIEQYEAADGGPLTAINTVLGIVNPPAPDPSITSVVDGFCTI